MVLATAFFGTSLLKGLFVVLNILLMEVLLSIDNAAALSLVVGGLPPAEQPKALKYGIVGAFILRGAALAFVAILLSFWWLKIIGGLWLIWLTYKHFTSSGDDDVDSAESSPVFKWITKYITPFWATVVVVELMDMAFSMDNIFAVTTYTSYIGLIWIGVGIGIVLMRWVAKKFLIIMEVFPFMANVAYIVIGVLGVKLTLTILTHYSPKGWLAGILDSKNADLYTSFATLAIFLAPVITSVIFNYPKKVIPPKPTPLTEEADKALSTVDNSTEV